jgi:hypothetical protein
MSWISLFRNNSTIRWAAGGWTFFIAENAILSENRTWLISELGNEQYHLMYGTLSTIATASIGYAYYKIQKSSITPQRLRLPIPTAVGGWILLSIGLGMASQVAPKLQIPVAMVDSAPSVTADTPVVVGPSVPSSTKGDWKLQVRCPFDFADKRDPHQQGGTSALHGLERISRHPGLWSLGLVGLGQAMLAPAVPQMIWWCGPAAIAWLGGGHTDSRFRRGIGGTMSPEYESQTSNIPFWAIVSGKQGSGSAQALWQEVKPLNAGVALAVSSLWVLRRVR